MRVGGYLAGLAERIGEQAERARRRYLWVQLAQAAGRRVARVGIGPQPGRHLRLVQAQEVGLGHEYLAADLDAGGGGAVQPLGYGVHGAEVRRDVLALRPVAAGGAVQQAAVHVGERDRQAIDLGFGHQGQRVVLQAEEPAHAHAELVELRPAERIVQAQHRHGVADLGEAARRFRPDPAARAVRADQARKARLDRGIALAQRVVGGVRDLGRVFRVVQPVVVRDLAGQPLEFGGRLLLGQFLRQAVGHGPRQSRRKSPSSLLMGWFTTRSGISQMTSFGGVSWNAGLRK